MKSGYIGVCTLLSDIHSTLNHRTYVPVLNEADIWARFKKIGSMRDHFWRCVKQIPIVRAQVFCLISFANESQMKPN
jgi:hypothetical protein